MRNHITDHTHIALKKFLELYQKNHNIHIAKNHFKTKSQNMRTNLLWWWVWVDDTLENHHFSLIDIVILQRPAELWWGWWWCWRRCTLSSIHSIFIDFLLRDSWGCQQKIGSACKSIKWV